MNTSFKLLIQISVFFSLMSCVSTKTISQNTMAKIEYELSMPAPQTHYFHVKMKVNGINEIKKGEKVAIKMAVWTPGSYLIREYPKNVESVSAKSETQTLPIIKTAKNVWEVDVKNCKENSIIVEYDVYAFELTVRTSFIDDSHGYINGASIFMYLDEYKNNTSVLKIIPYQKWKKVSTALKEIGTFTYQISSLDELIDSPIEIGNQQILTFEAAGVKHTIANYSNTALLFDEKKVIDTYKKVVEAATTVVGEHPCKEYLFIVHHLPNIGGGLEHLYSTTCQTSPNAYMSDKGFKGFMGLIAHEYFHLWNVKRIRPIALGPFDYEKENYTTMLWVSEGFTSFYQDDILRRANVIDENEYLNTLSGEINSIENIPGQRVQTVAESSFDAWIKYYRPNENYNNANISYYSKGGVLGTLLNLEIIANTNAEKSLDDVMKYLWKEYYLTKKRGFTDEEFKLACEKIAGKQLDYFFDNYVNGLTPIDYANFYNKAGISIENKNAGKDEPFVGIRLAGTRITALTKGSGAYENGLSVNDEIVEIDGKAFTDLDQFKTKKIGESYEVKVKRSGEYIIYTIPVLKSPSVSYLLSADKSMTKEQEKVYKKFMHL